MVAASQTLVPIMADCSSPNQNTDLKAQFAINSFPTVLFTDSKGKEVERLQSRDAPQVAAQIDRIVQAHAIKVFRELDLPGALEAAKGESKLLGILWVEEGKQKVQAKIDMFRYALVAEQMEGLRDRLVWVTCVVRKDKKQTEEAKAYNATKAPTLQIVDPSVEDPADSVLKKFTSPKKLVKDLKKLLAKHAG